MNHSLILNLAIIALIGVALWLTKDALVLMGLMFLKDMPYGLLADNLFGGGDDDDGVSRPIGFIHNDD